MLKSPDSNIYHGLVVSFLVTIGCLSAVTAWCGSYLDSAHGNANYGVDRASVGSYAAGNCAHCHEQHASIQGVEPDPAESVAAHTLFAHSFNTNRTQNLYLESDNFCFYCHSGASGQQVVNQDYSASFGGSNMLSGPQSIIAAFNQTSYHNLYDIWSFLSADPAFSTWFAHLDNPCSACHNSHLAKRNWDSTQPGFPLLSAISPPGTVDVLWGETEVMSSYFGYEAPYASDPNREPAEIGEADGSNTPDYVAFCKVCHNSANTIWSTTLGRNIKKINWDVDLDPFYDKHGTAARDGTDHFLEPYASAALLKSNFVLSCLDCHESHGSENIMMLRRRINGEDLEGVVSTTDNMSYACKRCHPDDLAAGAGTGEANRWEYIHHLAPGRPYAKNACTDCHMTGGNPPPQVACGNCHGHGMDDSWVPSASQSGRTTF